MTRAEPFQYNPTTATLEDSSKRGGDFEWRDMRLCEIGQVVTGATPSTKEPSFFGGKYMFITPGDIGEARFLGRTNRYLTDKGLRVVRELPKNSVVVTCIGIIGKVGITSTERSASNQQINAVIPNLEIILPEFLYYSLLARSSELETLASRTVLPILKKSVFADFCLRVPEVEEQKKIVQILNSVQDAKDARRRELTLERERKAALVEHLFTHGTRSENTKETEIGEIPESWRLVEAGAVADIGNGSTPSRKDERYWNGGTIPWITSTKVHEVVIRDADEFVTETARTECHLPLVPRHSIVVAITGQGKTLGNSAILELDTCINQHLAYLQFTDESIRPSFALFYLRSRYDYFRNVSAGGGSTKGALTCGFLKRLKIPVPLSDEQDAIAQVLSACEDKCGCLEKEVVLLDEFFMAVLGELMSGRLDVNSLTDGGKVS